MKPIYTLHKLLEGFIVTSDEQVEKGNIVLETLIDGKKELFEIHTLNDINLERQVKVIAQQDQIDFSSLSIEEQKEIGYFDVVNFSQKHKDLQLKSGKDLSHSISSMYGFMDGFKTAQELLSDRIFTLKEVKQSLFDLADVFFNNCQKGITEEDCQKYQNIIIQSLSQKSWKIEIEHTCNGIRKEGESCTLNNKCTYPNCGKIKILNLC